MLSTTVVEELRCFVSLFILTGNLNDAFDTNTYPHIAEFKSDIRGRGAEWLCARLTVQPFQYDGNCTSMAFVEI